jgi:phosphoribosylglycinamide formyltransferase-1
MRVIRLGILGSGTGSNMLALLEAIRSGNLKAEVIQVMSDVAEAKILDYAKRAGIAAEWIDCQGYDNRFPEDAQQQTAKRLLDAGVDLVCLAGFMRIIKPVFLSMFPGCVINIHPSLLPLFPGMKAWKQALEAGATETGCTVHFVDAGMDTGPIIIQAKVPVHAQDDELSLHRRIQQQEHIIYPQAVRLVAASLGFPS